MLDFDQLQELIQQIIPDDISFDHLALDHLADIISNAGIDLSQLSAQDIDTLMSIIGDGIDTSDQDMLMGSSIPDTYSDLSIHFDGSDNEVFEIQNRLAAHNQLKFGSSGQQVNAPFSQQAPMIQISDLQSLQAVYEVLAEMHKSAWVNIIVQGVPEWITLEDWMQQQRLL